jgi:hypothetical protein
MKICRLFQCLCAAALLPCSASAMTLGAFGPHGEGGSKHAQTWNIGSGGSVYELDAFVFVKGYDLNGSGLPGTAAALSRDALPPGLTYQFAAVLSTNAADLTLVYTFSNATAAAFSDLRFAVFFDAEIDQTLNTFFNEYAVAIGPLGTGSADPAPDQWQVDEPGFPDGTLLSNLYLGALSNSNAIPQTAPNDVALGLGFNLGTLWPGAAVTVRIMISEAGGSLGAFALQHRDADAASTTAITLSGLVDPRSAVSGFVFKDFNRNALPEMGEGLPGVIVFADLNGDGARAASEPSTVTTANGSYLLPNLNAGLVKLRLVTSTLPAGITPSTDPDGLLDHATALTLAAGETQTNVNWGYQNLPLVAGIVFLDANKNGVPDVGEGLGGVNVFADLNNNGIRTANEPQATTTTSGTYTMANLNVGPLTLRVVTNTLPAGLAPSFDPDGVRDHATTLTLAPGDTRTNLHWGYQSLPSVAGAVFKDSNKNSLFDSGEGLANVIVFADLDGNGTRTTGEPFATTATDGRYSISNLSIGPLTVRVATNTVPTGLTNSIDPDGVLDHRTVVTLALGHAVTNLVWGYRDIIPPAVFTNTTSLVQFGLTWRLNTSAGTLIGTLHLTNPPTAGVNLRAPVQIGFPSSTNYYLVHPVGNLPSGLPYVDLSAVFAAQLGSGGQLAPGARISLDGVEVYSRDRSAPPKASFEIWATRAQ